MTLKKSTLPVKSKGMLQCHVFMCDVESVCIVYIAVVGSSKKTATHTKKPPEAPLKVHVYT